MAERGQGKQPEGVQVRQPTPLLERLRLRHEVGVRENHALRLAGRAGGEEQERGILRADPHEHVGEIRHVSSRRGAQLDAGHVEPARFRVGIMRQKPCSGSRDDASRASRRRVPVDRNDDSAAQDRAERGRRPLGAVHAPERYSVAAADAVRLEHGGEPQRVAMQPREAPPPHAETAPQSDRAAVAEPGQVGNEILERHRKLTSRSEDSSKSGSQYDTRTRLPSSSANFGCSKPR